MAQDRWEHFATTGAERHICTEIDSSTPEGRQAFFRSGEEYVEAIVAELDGLVAHRRAALDFGCGVGRLAVPLARRFARVTAVDISPTMLDGLRRNCDERELTNVTPCLTQDDWESTGPFDLVNSLLVFQHLPDDDEVATYLSRLASCMADDALAVLQFDSRPASLAYRTRNALPDPVLLPRWRSGLRRIRRSPAQVHALLAGAGLRLVDERGAGTELHMARARRATR